MSRSAISRGNGKNVMNVSLDAALHVLLILSVLVGAGAIWRALSVKLKDPAGGVADRWVDPRKSQSLALAVGTYHPGGSRHGVRRARGMT